MGRSRHAIVRLHDSRLHVRKSIIVPKVGACLMRYPVFLMPAPKQRSYRVTGGHPLIGEVSIPGAKNAATKELVATLLADEPVTLTNVPKIGDVDVTLDILRELGAKVTVKGSTVTVDASTVKTSVVSKAFSRKNRIPILLIGPL